MCCIVLKCFYLCVIKANQTTTQQKINKMKKQSINLFTGLTEAQVNSLTAIVAETLAFNQKKPKTRVFTAAELWNIQREKKVISTRRHFL